MDSCITQLSVVATMLKVYAYVHHNILHFQPLQRVMSQSQSPVHNDYVCTTAAVAAAANAVARSCWTRLTEESYWSKGRCLVAMEMGVHWDWGGRRTYTNEWRTNGKVCKCVWLNTRHVLVDRFRGIQMDDRTTHRIVYTDVGNDN